VKKEFRLTRSTDFKRVRRYGKSYAHPLVVMYTTSNGDQQTRIGITAGKWIGSSVKRNRAKRLLREAIRSIYPKILPGADLLLVARSRLPMTNLDETQAALMVVLSQARLISTSYDSNTLSTE
jgi:ribonuclease P protein component